MLNCSVQRPPDVIYSLKLNVTRCGTLRQWSSLRRMSVSPRSYFRFPVTWSHGHITWLVVQPISITWVGLILTHVKTPSELNFMQHAAHVWTNIVMKLGAFRDQNTTI